MQELEDQALVSGDWSKVENRELFVDRKNKKHGPECAEGLTSVCFESGTSRRL